VLPHEARLPHVDVISERLETLIALAKASKAKTAPTDGEAPAMAVHRAPLVVTSVIALLQRTFAHQTLGDHTRALARGDRIDPLDLVEWLEEQGYEPEAQVTQKGEIALRGGILDVYPLTSPWPVRVEFFGDEIESLRYFDPLTQISRDGIAAITIPPAGELGLLQRGAKGNSKFEGQGLGALLDYLPAQTIFLLFEPEQLSERADGYAAAIPPNDPFFIAWDEFQQQLVAKGMTVLQAEEAELDLGSLDVAATERGWDARLASLDAFRPLAERPPEPQVAETQRREFFDQLHRWLRQGYAVHVFCNNDGERQRFAEIWQEYGLGAPAGTGAS
jgi:hypothetical protein